jgi:hypothetical protein
VPGAPAGAVVLRYWAWALTDRLKAACWAAVTEPSGWKVGSCFCGVGSRAFLGSIEPSDWTP